MEQEPWHITEVLEEVHSTQAAASGSLLGHTRKQARKRHHICTRENADLLIQAQQQRPTARRRRKPASVGVESC